MLICFSILSLCSNCTLFEICIIVVDVFIKFSDTQSVVNQIYISNIEV